MEWPNCDKKCAKKLESKAFGNRQFTGLMGTGCGGSGARGAVRIAVRSVKWPLWRGSLVCSPISGPVLGLKLRKGVPQFSEKDFASLALD